MKPDRKREKLLKKINANSVFRFLVSVNTPSRPRRTRKEGVFIKQKQNVSHASAMFFHSVRSRVHFIPQNKYQFTVRRRTNKNAGSTADTEEVLSFLFFCTNKTVRHSLNVWSNLKYIYFTATSAGHVFFA